MIGRRALSAHPTDEEMLLVVDRECSLRRAVKLRSHLAECTACHARMAKLESTLADFIALHEAGVQPHGVPGSRAALKERLHQAGRPASASSAGGFPWQLAGACVALLIVASSVWSIRNAGLRRSNRNTVEQLASLLPQKTLTPGAASLVGVNDLCGSPEVENDPPVNPSVEQAVFREYGLPVSSKDSYEVDYLISPALGGTNDIRNLWPEPYSPTSWGAHAKDELENHLHTMVCQGKLPLSTAQNEIAGDWIAAYKLYFHTDAPLSNAATLTLPPARHQGASTFEASRMIIPNL